VRTDTGNIAVVAARSIVLGVSLVIAGHAIVGSTCTWAQAPSRSADTRSADTAKPEIDKPAADKRAVSGRSPEDKLLQATRALARQEHYREAQRLLIEYFSSSRGRAQEGSTSRSLATLLGSTYLWSGAYDQAATWFERTLRKVEALAPSRRVLAERSSIAISLAQTYSARDQKPKAVGVLKSAYDQFRTAGIVDPASQIGILAELALLGERQLELPKTSTTIEKEVNRLTERLQTAYRQSLIDRRQYRRGMKGLARYQQVAGHRDESVATLRVVLRLAKEDKDLHAQIATGRQLAEIFRSAGRTKDETEALRTVLSLTEDNPKDSASDRAARFYQRAQTEQDLSLALERSRQIDDAGGQLQAARRDYLESLNYLRRALAATQSSDDHALDVSEIALLERIAETSAALIELPGATSRQAEQAIASLNTLLQAYEAALLASDPRIGRLHVTLAGFYVTASRFEDAQRELAAAERYWRNYRPPNYRMLVETLNLMAETSLAKDSVAKAEKSILEAAQIAEQHLPRDELRWWTRLNQGRLSAAGGHYQQALHHFGAILGIPPDEAPSPKLRSAAYLHLGLLHKDLLQFDDALRYCQKAVELRQEILGNRHVELAPYYLAIGGLHVARRDPESLEQVVRQVQEIQSGASESDPNVLARRHLEAMVHYLRDEQQANAEERGEARRRWQTLLAICPKQSALQARTLHYLARLEYLDWSADANARKQQLLTKQKEEFRRYDARFAAYTRRAASLDERLKTYEHDGRRYQSDLDAYELTGDAQYSDQLQTYNALVDRRSKLEGERTDLRRLRDQLETDKRELSELAAAIQDHAAKEGTNVRADDRLTRGADLATEAVATLERLGRYPGLQYAALCNLAQICHAKSRVTGERDTYIARARQALEKAIDLVETPRASTFGGALVRAEFFAQYHAAFDLLVQMNAERGDVRDAIATAERGRSRTLLDELRSADIQKEAPSSEKIAAVVERWQNSPQPLLYYHVGPSASYLFVLGGTQHRSQVFPLKIAADPAAPSFTTDASARFVAKSVSGVRKILSDPSYSGVRSLRSRLADVAAVLLPAEVVKYLRDENARGVSHVTVVPDGAIAQLPLEALVVSPERDKTFLLDACPPISYAPSLAALEEFSRKRAGAEPSPALLTVANPDYAIGVSTFAAVERIAPASSGPHTARRLPLEPLPFSQDESREVAEAFAQKFGSPSVTALVGRDTTERTLREAIARRGYTILHFAVHGVMDKETSGVSVYIALSLPPRVESHEDDGCLEWQEVHELDLSSCRLVMLSACETNLAGVSAGRAATDVRSASARQQVQDDPSFSLASAFLASGSRRVLATQWKVADDSTTQLIAAFSRKLTAALASGRQFNHARLLAEARQELRKTHPEWDTPFHWAPFILIGPAGDGA